MRRVWTEDMIGHAIDEAYYEISVLGDEMREAFDNTPEYFKENSGKGRELAADLLEAVSSPSVPSSIEFEAITWIEKRPSPSERRLLRPARRDNATSALRSCIGHLRPLAAEDKELRKLTEELVRDVTILDSIVFPGMRGR